MAHFISDGSPEIKIENEVVTCTAENDHDNTYSAMWVDGSGNGVNFGEHYWTIELKDVENSAWVGLSNATKHKKGYAGKGLFYGGNLSDGGCLLVSNFGPRPSGNVKIGMLVSFVDSKLQVYFYHDGKPLGLAFDVEASILPDACPVVKFSSGKGSAEIRKEETIPTDRVAPLKQFEGIEGSWKVVANSVKLNGEVTTRGDNFVNVKISSGEEQQGYDVHLRVINSIYFRIEKTEGTWKNTGGGRSTKMGSTPENMHLEGQFSDLFQDPTSVTIDNNVLTITKGNSSASFERYDDSPKAYTGNPFS